MSDNSDEYKQFIQAADSRSLIRQLRSDIKEPLVSAQNLINVLIMMQSPSAAIQEKIDSGELSISEMLDQLTGFVNQTLDVIDYYQSTLDEA